MKFWQVSCAVLVVGLAAQNSFGAPEPGPQQKPASETITDTAKAGIKAAYPDATLGDSKLTLDRGIQVYDVAVTGDKSVDTVEVCAATTNFSTECLVMQGSLKIGKSDLPATVAKAADTAAAPSGPIAGNALPATFLYAEKIDLRSDITPHPYKSDGKYNLVSLPAPVTVYDVYYKRGGDGLLGVVRVGADGTVIPPQNARDVATLSADGKGVVTVSPDSISPINWMKHAAADVPAGKTVIRVNVGGVADYTDLSGTLWVKDRPYGKGNTFGWTDGRPNSRVNLIVPGTDAPFIYDCERDKDGSYRFDVPNGTYTVRMHMCESWEPDKKVGHRGFGIKIQGKEVVNHIDITGTVKGWLMPLVLEYKDIAVTDGKLLVQPFSDGNDQHPTLEAYEVYAQ